MKIIRYSLLFLIFSTLLIFSLFPRPIFLKCVEWQASHFFAKTFDAQCNIEKITFKKGKLFFHQVQVFKRGEFEAEFSATLTPKFHLKEKELGGRLEISDFKLVHRKTDSEITLPKFKKWSFFSLNLTLEAKDLEICLYDYQKEAPLFQRFCFDWNQKFFKGETCGTLLWKVNENEIPVIHFRTEESQFLVSSDFKVEDFSSVFNFLRYFFKSSPFFANWIVKGGSFQGKIEAILQGKEAVRIKTDSELSHVKAENIPYKTLLEFENLTANLDADCATPSGFNGKFLLKEGQLSFQKNPISLWDLHQLNGELFIQEGHLVNSSIRGNFLGGEGELVLDAASEEFFRINLSSLSKKITPLFSKSFQKVFKKAFPDDMLSLKASLKKEEEKLALRGIASVSDKDKNDYQFEFGFFLKQITFPISNLFESVKNQLLEKPCGWVKAKKIPLEKFLAPFLLKDVNLSLSGISDLEMHFENPFLEIFYDGENIALESPFYSVKVPKIKEEKARHLFDFEKKVHQGFLRIDEGTYTQKNYDLFLPKVSGAVFFNNGDIRIRKIEAKWQDLKFLGEVDVQIRSLDDVGLNLKATHAEGPASQAQSLLKRFTSSFFWEIPLERGEAEGSFCFQYHFNPSSTLKTGKIAANLKEGAYEGLGAVKEYGAEIEYDFVKNSVWIKKGKGKFSPPGKETFYEFETPEVVFTEFPHFQIDLSLDVEKEKAHHLSLKAKTMAREGGRDILIESPLFSLHGHQNAKEIVISDYSLGPWKGNAEIALNGENSPIEGWEISKLTFRKENRAGFEFSGHFNPREKQLLGKVEDFFFNLDDFAEKKLTPWPAKGSFQGNGELVWKIGEDLCFYGASQFKGLEFGRVLFGDGEDLKCFYSSKFGLTVEGLSVEVPTKAGLEKYRIGQFSYDISKKKFQFEGFDFSLPSEKLTDLTEALKTLFPEKIDPFLFESLQKIKQGEPLEGRVSFEMYPDSLWVYLNLKEGSYFLAERKLELKNFLLVFDPSELQIRTAVLYKNTPYYLHLKSDSMTLTHGKLAISEKPFCLDASFGKDALQVTWERHKERGNGPWNELV